MRKMFYVLLSGVCLCTRVNAQVSGTVSVPGTYSDIATLLEDLNQNGTSGPVIINIAAGYTETAIAGGFTLSASGNPTAPIVFQKQGTGNNPLIVAYVGNKTPGSAIQDGIFRLNGCDHVLINGIDLFDGNTTNPATMEFGYGLFKSGPGNGCQHVIIKNCVVSLRRSNNSSGSGPAADGSRGIEMVNGLMSSHNASLAITSAGGAHSNNTFISNRIQDCNIGVSLSGFITASSFSYCDMANEVGSLNAALGNTVVNFGGGGSNASAGIRALGQYDMLVASNLVNSDNGSGSPHPGTLRGIHIGTSPGANITVRNNTVSVHGGGTGNNVSCIENSGGSGGATNNVTIRGNKLVNSTYDNAVNGSFYGIWNNASSAVLSIAGNTLHNNSSKASAGSNYLLYNNGAVTNRVEIDSNQISFNLAGSVSYTGTFYGIYNTSAAPTATIGITGNTFKNFFHENSTGTGVLYFIYNTADVNYLTFSRNKWQNLQMNHSGPEYFIYNASSTNSLLTVASNSVLGHARHAPSANLYFYYGAATAPATATHVIVDNLVSSVNSTISGTGNFYGLYCAEGNNAPYPLKTITANTITNVKGAGSGNFYGIYASDLGDAGTSSVSAVSDNFVTGCEWPDAIYGLYCVSPNSATNPTQVKKNTIRGITSYTASAHGVYLGSNNAGVLFSGNRISGIGASGATGTAYGLYGTTTSTSNVTNNIIGGIEAPASSGANRCNGIYINTGTLVNLCYNSVWVAAASTGSNFGSNAVYVSSTAGVLIKNNLFINTSTVTGSGIAAAYRRSSAAVTNYNTASGNNLYFAGAPSSAHPLFYNGSSYSTLASFQTFVSPREGGSVTQMPVFRSLNALSPYYLHMATFTASSVESGASTLTAVSADYDDEWRFGVTGYPGSGTAPDIGADEFETNTAPCVSVSPAALMNLSLTVCSGQTISLIATSVTPGSGLQHTWKTGTVSGGPYSNTVSVVPEYFSPALNAGTYYFVLESTCPGASVTALSPEATVVVKPLPVANAMAQSTLVCAGDTIKLSVVGGSTAIFGWTGPDGFYSSEQNPVLVARHAGLSGSYSVEVIEGTCASVAGIPVHVTVNQISFAVTATRGVICKGDTTTLIVSGPALTNTWSTGSTSAGIAVSPVLTTIYSVTVEDSLSCTAQASVLITVIENTLVPVNATVCGAVVAATLSVRGFTPSLVEWYSDPSDTIILITGNTFTLPGSSTDTVYAASTAFWPSALATAMNGNDLAKDIMFDVVALTNVRIRGLDLHLPSTAIYSIAVWYRPGGYLSASTSSAGWISAGVCTVSGSGVDQLTSIPILTELPVKQTNTVGIYVSVNGGSLYCSNTSSLGSPWATNNDAAISSGATGSYFNCTTGFRGVNGQVRYLRELCSGARVPVTLLVANVPTVSAFATPSLICPGQSATLSSVGAATYSWSGISSKTMVVVHPLSPETYTVTGTTLQGCKATDTVVVGVLPLPVVSVTAASTLVCPSSAVVLFADGALTYAWNTGAIGASVSVNPAANTTYSVFGTNLEGCMATATIGVQTKTVPVIKIQQSADTVCPFTPVVLKATGAISYTWLPGNSSQQTTTVFPSVTSVFNALGLSVNTCTGLGFAFIYVDPCVDDPDERRLNGCLIYPNPCNSVVDVRLPAGNKIVQVYCSTGVLVQEFFSDQVDVKMNFSELPSGVYCLQVRYPSRSFSFRLVKE